MGKLSLTDFLFVFVAGPVLFVVGMALVVIALHDFLQWAERK